MFHFLLCNNNGGLNEEPFCGSRLCQPDDVGQQPVLSYIYLKERCLVCATGSHTRPATGCSLLLLVSSASWRMQLRRAVGFALSPGQSKLVRATSCNKTRCAHCELFGCKTNRDYDLLLSRWLRPPAWALQAAHPGASRASPQQRRTRADPPRARLSRNKQATALMQRAET